MKGQQDENETDEHLKRPDGKYLFTGKIVCGVCGRSFCRKKANAGTAYAASAWVCNGYATIGKKAWRFQAGSRKVLIPIVAELLGVEEEAMPAAVSRISAMTIYPDEDWRRRSMGSCRLLPGATRPGATAGMRLGGNVLPSR